MTTILVIILLIAGVAFYYYRKAKAKQAELRAKARRYYGDIRDAVLVWRNDKSNEEKIALALAALEIYDYWVKEAEFFPITFKQLHPE